MKNKIFAYISLVLFLFLLANIFVFQKYQGLTVFIYVIIITVYLIFFSNKDSAFNDRKTVEDMEMEYKKNISTIFKLGYDKKEIELTINNKNILYELETNSIEDNLLSEEDIIKKSLSKPISSNRLFEIVNKEDKISIITSDITRPMPSSKVLPYVIEELKKARIPDENIEIILALGSHRKHTIEEKIQITGKEIFEKYSVYDSDCNNTISLGKTKKGTKVDIDKRVVNSNKVICLGNIEYHYFAGYSGGAKAIMPGVSNNEAIQTNHSMMVNNNAYSGNLNNNPVREDIEDAINYQKIDFIVNVVLDQNKTIKGCFSGHYIDAHRAGCKFLDSLFKVKINQKADIVITTPGGYPKDLNLYQAQKALDNAKHAVKENGIIILLAACKEGYGSKTFEKWVNQDKTPNELVEDIENNFELGGHKAAAIAQIALKNEIYIVSDLSDEMAKKVYMKSYKDINKALEDAFCKLGNSAKIIIMPHGGSTLPELK